MEYSEIKERLISLFSETSTQLFLCENSIRIPSEELRPEILAENHSSAIGGHKGITKTYRRIREKYYWSSLKSDVQEYVSSCEVCQRSKLTRVKTRQPMTLTDTPGQAFDKIAMDIMGPLPTTPSGFSYILTIQDLLTKYSVAAPLRTTSAIDTADAFIKSFICRFGSPKAILTDQGANFLSSLMRAVAKKFRITQYKTTAFRPESNGSVERSHHVLSEYLKHFIKRNNWDEHLDLAMLSYNTSVHEGTNFTPHELVFGKIARLPSANTPFAELENETHAGYLANLKDKLLCTIGKARENLNNAKLKSKAYYDRKINPRAFQINDRVYLLKEPSRGKFDDQYTGPHNVLEILSNGNIRISYKNKERVVHPNKLKLIKTPLPRVHTINACDKPVYKHERKTHQRQLKPSNMTTTLLICCAFLIPATTALIGYDCGGASLNVSTYSMVDQPQCEPTTYEPTMDTKEIQLLQLADFNSAHTIQCRIEIDRTIYYCGMNSHIAIVENSRQKYLFPTTRDTCQTLVSTGAISILPNVQLTGIVINQTATRSLTLSGMSQMDGSCSGSTYSDPFGTWSNVVVQALIEITVKTLSAVVNIHTNRIHLPSGQECRFQQASCLDMEDGHTFWDVVPPGNCGFNAYDVLYEGKATKISNPRENTVIYTVASGDVAFALTETRRSGLCGYMIIHTEHPKLFILNTAAGKFKSRTTTETNNLDLFTYVNAKFVFVEKHIKTQIIQLYKDTIIQKCQLQRQIIKNILSLIHAAPEDVASTLANGPGHMAIQAGEAIHLVKCIPVTVYLRRTDRCYEELPVTYRNESFFLTPINNILTPMGTHRECNELIPTMYRLHGTWYKLLPKPSEALPPPALGDPAISQWKYMDPGNIATGGIYSPDELNTLRDHIMFPVQKNAIVNSLAQGASGRSYVQDNVRMYNLIDSQSLEKIAESAMHKLWNGFTQFGSISAGIFGIYLTFKLIKLVINTVLNGITLHATYGWSLRMFAAIWSGLTHFILHLRRKNDATEETPQLRECVPSPDPLYETMDLNGPPEPPLQHMQTHIPTANASVSFRTLKSDNLVFPRSYRRPASAAPSDDSRL